MRKLNVNPDQRYCATLYEKISHNSADSVQLNTSNELRHTFRFVSFVAFDPIFQFAEHSLFGWLPRFCWISVTQVVAPHPSVGIDFD